MTNVKTAEQCNSRVPLSIAALGVVYGDIGTSPLYAFRVSLNGLPINEMAVLGVLSLIFWSLIFVISIKYLIILCQADNEGEGGILALLALVQRYKSGYTRLFFILGIFGAGLMLGDGMLTPAISVISAIEGVNVIFPTLSDWVLPVTLMILAVLFSFQSMGTAKIGFVFGPVLLLWFMIIGTLGFAHILNNPLVLKAMNPYYAVEFFCQDGWRGYTILGAIFLVMTGGEALYADLGHFGKLPIRLSWFLVVLPALLLNYFGQGAYILLHPEGVPNPFYMLAPSWFSIPLLIMATLATIIASQAVISAVFSLTKQAVLLGFYPHLPIVQTSETTRGQVYVPQMNVIMAIGTMLLILAFRSSTALTEAYGVAVNLVMLLTSVLLIQLALTKWQWSPVKVGLLLSIFCVIDLAFLGSNVQKLEYGGWVSILSAVLAALVMYTWHEGTDYLRKQHYVKKGKLSKILMDLDLKTLTKSPNSTAIFITDIYDKSGGSFLQYLKLSHTLPENILIVNYIVENVPYVNPEDRFQLTCLRPNICELTLHYGFMNTVSIPRALKLANKRHLLSFEIDVDTVMYTIEIPNVIASRHRKSLPFYWQDQLFAFLVRNYSANLNIEFYQLPYNRTIALGAYYII